MKKLTALVFLILFGLNLTDLNAQNGQKPPANWFNLDLADDGIPGVSTEKAYSKLLKKRPSKKSIIVAVIDSGIDIEHEDLKDVLWTNKKEIPANGIDDDGNGYIDDVHGWNFIGGSQANVEFDTYEVTRIYARLLKKYLGKSKSEIKSDEEYELFKQVQEEVEGALEKKVKNYKQYEPLVYAFNKAHDLLKLYADVDVITKKELDSIKSPDPVISQAVQLLTRMQEQNIDADVVQEIQDYFEVAISKGFNVNYDPRYMVGDDYDNLEEVGYGNPDVIGVHNFHGTHVAGIIGANRKNNIGIKGVADDVQIMALRAVPNGDERDKDIANAIIYAVDNGAKIVNMSFGKGYSPSKSYIDAAVRHAEENGVLLVHAAGNSSENNDPRTKNFPHSIFENGKEATNWLEIGASTFQKDSLVAEFSNYGKTSVDFFAPGYEINSCKPGNAYKASSGTSMASPVTAGVAALLWSRYPKLTVTELREVLVNSSIVYEGKVTNKPGTEERVGLKEISRQGSVVNVYSALIAAKKLYKSKKYK